MLSSDIRLQAGFASARRQMLMGLYNMALSKSRLAFTVTTEAEAQDRVRDIRTILIMDGPKNDLVAAGHSEADAVLHEDDCFGEEQPCFGEEQPLVTMIRTLAIGQRYRSASVLAAMKGTAGERKAWRDAPPDLSGRERDHVSLLVQGLGDQQIAEQLEIG